MSQQKVHKITQPSSRYTWCDRRVQWDAPPFLTLDTDNGVVTCKSCLDKIGDGLRAAAQRRRANVPLDGPF